MEKRATDDRQTRQPAKSAHALISRRCVNDCVFCAVAEKRRGRMFPDPEEIFAFIDESAAAGTTEFVFSGLGEPTLDEHFEEYLEHAAGRGFRHLCLFTNCYDLSREKAERWYGHGLDTVLVSVHGLEPGHDRNVGRHGSYREAIAGVEIFTTVGYRVSVNTCLTRYNLGEIEGLIEELARYPLRAHSLSFPEWSGNALRDHEPLATYEEVTRMALDLPAFDSIQQRTYFENIPYCLVRRPTLELHKRNPTYLLEGGGKKEFRPDTGRVFPERCRAVGCRLLPVCPGFEERYIRVRGWGSVPEMVDEFLDSGHSRSLQRKKRSQRRSTNQETSETGPSLCAILKPVAACNGACTYCSSHSEADGTGAGRNTGGRMSVEDAVTGCRRLTGYARGQNLGTLTLLWHGGEPMLSGVDFYRRVLSELAGLSDGEQRELRIKNLMQTNLTLLDDEWIDLFRRYEVGLSSSVDPLLPDLRRYATGGPMFPDWIRNYTKAVKAGLSVGVVFTVSSAHRGMAQKLYRFVRNLGDVAGRPVNLRLNPLYPEGRASSGQARDLAADAELYGEFLVQFREEWVRDGRPFPAMPFIDLEKPGRRSCEFSRNCGGSFIGVGPDGRMARCGRYDRREFLKRFGKLSGAAAGALVGSSFLFQGCDELLDDLAQYADGTDGSDGSGDGVDIDTSSGDGSSFSEAIYFRMNTDVEVSMSEFGLTDVFYKFGVTEEDDYQLSFPTAGYEGYVYFYLYDEDETELTYGDVYELDEKTSGFQDLSPGMYYIEFVCDNGVIDFTFRVEEVPAYSDYSDWSDGVWTDYSDWSAWSDTAWHDAYSDWNDFWANWIDSW